MTLKKQATRLVRTEWQNVGELAYEIGRLLSSKDLAKSLTTTANSAFAWITPTDTVAITYQNVSYYPAKSYSHAGANVWEEIDDVYLFLPNSASSLATGTRYLGKYAGVVNGRSVYDVVVAGVGSLGLGDPGADRFLMWDESANAPAWCSSTDLAFSGTTVDIAADAVTFAKMQNITTDRLLGRDTAGTGDVEQISLNATLEFTGSTSIQRAALTGDVTASAGSNATTIANDAVTNAKLNDMAAWTVKVRNAGTTGDPSDAAVADVTTASPAAGDYVFGYLSTGEIRKYTVSSVGAVGTIDGSGTANTIAKWSDSDTITDSTITDDGTTVTFTKRVKTSVGTYSLTADQNNLDLGDVECVLVSTDATERKITGVAGGAAGRRLRLFNYNFTNSFRLTLNDSDSSASNRILYSGDSSGAAAGGNSRYKVAPGRYVDLQHDGTNWFIFDVAVGPQANVRTISSSTTLDDRDEVVLVDTGGGNVTVTLPTNGVVLHKFTLVKISASNTMTVSGILGGSVGFTEYQAAVSVCSTTSGDYYIDGSHHGDPSSAYTQTYSTADRTHADFTSATLTDNTGGTANTTVQALTDPADSPASADALRDDLVANLIPELRNNFADLTAQVNALRVDLDDVKRLCNSMIDDLQAKRILG